ncbi:MAG: hypothetical protein ACE5K0_01650 [Candidatus Methanofastidiosia archaeon]
MNQDSLLRELQEIQKIVMDDPTKLSPKAKKRFWKIVGIIKSDPSPNLQLIDTAAEIRDELFLHKLGHTKPMRVVMPIWTICGFGAIAISLLFTFPDLMYPAMYISWFFVVLFILGYLWIINVGKKWRLFIFGVFVGGTVALDLFYVVKSTNLLIEFNRYFMFASIPCFYLHGRYIGGLISGIKFDGVSRDQFYLPTLKINYRSYLAAKPPARQWIFFFGGIGTVVTSTAVATLQLLFFGSLSWYLIPAFLLFGEILDYLNLAGPLGGGEFNHLSREHRIIKKWKRKLKEGS